MKKAISILLILVLIFVPLVACANDYEEENDDPYVNGEDNENGDDDVVIVVGDLENVNLTLWGRDEDLTVLRERVDAFIASVSSEVNLTVDIEDKFGNYMMDAVLTDPQAAADVWTMTDNQLSRLYWANVLQEVQVNANEVRTANVSGAVEAASMDGSLVAYPLSVYNGYFLYYDSSIFSESDVQSWGRMLEVAEAAGVQVTMHIASSWYSLSFFRGAGLDAWPEGGGQTGTNIDDPIGEDVLQAMLDIVAHPAFIPLSDGDLISVMNEGHVMAGVNGAWLAASVESALGDNFAAAKLPTFNVGGQQVQMSGAVGFMFLGVNSHSENVEWAERLADFLTGYESQVAYAERPAASHAPTNVQAISSVAQSSPALAALGAQANYSAIVNLDAFSNFWAPMEELVAIIALGNPDNISLQELLARTAFGIRGENVPDITIDDTTLDVDDTEEPQEDEYDDEYDD